MIARALQLHRHAGFDSGQFGSWQFGTPLQTILADQGKQYIAGLHHGAQRGGAGCDGAIIRGQHTGLGEADFIAVYLGAQGFHPGLGG